MKSMAKEKKKWVTIGAILIILVFAFIVLNKHSAPTSEEIAKCIGQNSKLYIQTGCIHCENQLKLFGENQKYLNIYNCMDDNWKTCRELELLGTPTWIIKGTKYTGKQSIENLQKLTGC